MCSQNWICSCRFTWWSCSWRRGNRPVFPTLCVPFHSAKRVDEWFHTHPPHQHTRTHACTCVKMYQRQKRRLSLLLISPVDPAAFRLPSRHISLSLSFLPLLCVGGCTHSCSLLLISPLFVHTKRLSSPFPFSISLHTHLIGLLAPFQSFVWKIRLYIYAPSSPPQILPAFSFIPTHAFFLPLHLSCGSVRA